MIKQKDLFKISSTGSYSLRSDKIPMQLKKPRIASRPAESRSRLSIEEIRQIFVDHLPQLRKEYGIRNIWLFGSYVRGEQQKRSDLDVLVDFCEVPTLPKFISLERKLREISGIKVDLVSIRALRGERGERILREKVAL